jgi:hypothetical protein
MQSDSDKEAFLTVSTVVKKLDKALKEVIKEQDAKYKPDIKQLEEQVKTLKEKYKVAVTPYKEAAAELRRIDTNARDAISVYMTAKMEEARKAETPKPGQPAFAKPAATTKDMGISKGGNDLGFTTREVVHITDISKVPSELVTYRADENAWAEALSKLGIGNADLQTLANGNLTIKIAVDMMPDNLRERSGVKERAILELGGCAGVEIKEEVRAAVR